MTKEAKTTPNEVSVDDFIQQFADTEQKKIDSYSLLNLMKEVSGFEPKMWGPSIIGFGTYHYKYTSGHEGNAPLIGFSPRKSAISLYVFSGSESHEHLLCGLGKFKKGKACIYINKFSDINQDELVHLMKTTIKFLKDRYENN